MPDTHDAANLTVACHVRPSLILEPIDSKVETLRTCERDGTVDSLLLRSWPGEVAMTEDSPHPEVLERYDRFVEWAERVDADLGPAFQRRETTSLVTDTTIERLVTPGIALAFYHGDDIVGVFPHTDGETTHTVPEAIAALRTGELPDPLSGHPAIAESGASEIGSDASGGTGQSAPAPASALDGDVRDREDSAATSTGTSCPDCGERLTNVQGILDCGSCEWRAERTDLRLATR